MTGTFKYCHLRFLSRIIFVICCILRIATKVGANTQISTSDCGKTVGCFALPRQCISNCHTVHKYLFNEFNNSVQFDMQSTKTWSSLAFNTINKMPGIRGVACINSNGKVQLRSQKATSTKAPDMPIGSGLVKGNTVISTGIKDGVTFCKFTRTLTVPTGSEDYMYDLSNTNRFAVLASGMVASGEPQYHGFSNDYRIASQSPINIRAFKVQQMQTNMCDSTPCQNNISCYGNSTHYNCTCREDFTGKNCEIKIVIPNQCNSAPCLNNGSCHGNVNNFTCLCQDGFAGTFCEISPCLNHNCQNEGNCTLEPTQSKGYTCSCKQGFTGEMCQLVNQCSSSPCLNNGSCHGNSNNFTCLCPDGFTGHTCETKILQNKCESNPCLHNGSCHGDSNNYTCSCLPGFTGNKCQNSPCFNHSCQNEGSCMLDPTQSKGYKCLCKQGFSGEKCQIPKCVTDGCVMCASNKNSTCHCTGTICKIKSWNLTHATQFSCLDETRVLCVTSNTPSAAVLERTANTAMTELLRNLCEGKRNCTINLASLNNVTLDVVITCYKPEKPPIPLSLKIESKLKDHGVYISWKSPHLSSNYPCGDTSISYEIEIRKITQDQHQLENQQQLVRMIKTTNTSLTVHDLNPNTVYSFQIRAKNPTGPSNFTDSIKYKTNSESNWNKMNSMGTEFREKITGITIGGTALIIILLLIFICYSKKRKNNVIDFQVNLKKRYKLSGKVVYDPKNKEGGVQYLS